MGSTAARARTIVTFTASLLQAGAAIAIVYLVANRLQSVQVADDNRSFEEVQCALDKATRTDPSEDSLCKLAYIGSAITFAALVGLSLLLVRPWHRGVKFAGFAVQNARHVYAAPRARHSARPAQGAEPPAVRRACVRQHPACLARNDAYAFSHEKA